MLVATACTTAPTEAFEADVSLYALVSTIDGTTFLPPLGPEPGPTTGTFDPTQLSHLQVVLEREDAAGRVTTLGTFSSTTQPRLTLLAAHELYWMNVPAAAYFTDPSQSYRFRVLLDGREIGRSDMSSKVFEVMSYVPTLPIGVKLRLEARPAPAISALSPASALEGSSVTVTVTGSSFASDSLVLLAGQALPVSRLSSTQLTASLSAALLASAGTFDLTVSTPAPGGGASQALAFTVDHAAPVITALVPANANRGTSNLALTVRGSAFVAGALVRFAGTALATTFVSSTELRAVVPGTLLANLGTAAVTVTNPAPSLPGTGGATFSIVPVCGNGLLDPGETCDGNCPTSCDDGNVCTTDALVGAAATCNAACTHTPIANCSSTFHDSVIVDQAQSDQINAWVGTPGHVWTRCFTSRQMPRGGEYGSAGWAYAFHNSCNNRGATVTIAQMSTGVKIGGYRSTSWTGAYGVAGRYVYDASAFLFSLTNNFKHTQGGVGGAGVPAAYDRYDYGPNFGGYGLDWVAWAGDGPTATSTLWQNSRCNLGYTFICRVGTYGSTTCTHDFCGDVSASPWWLSFPELEVWAY